MYIYSSFTKLSLRGRQTLLRKRKKERSQVFHATTIAQRLQKCFKSSANIFLTAAEQLVHRESTDNIQQNRAIQG